MIDGLFFGSTTYLIKGTEVILLDNILTDHEQDAKFYTMT